MYLAQSLQGFLKFRRDIDRCAFQFGIFVHDDNISSNCNHVKERGKGRRIPVSSGRGKAALAFFKQMYDNKGNVLHLEK